MSVNLWTFSFWVCQVHTRSATRADNATRIAGVLPSDPFPRRLNPEWIAYSEYFLCVSATLRLLMMMMMMMMPPPQKGRSCVGGLGGAPC
jgi:hypothetical protein